MSEAVHRVLVTRYLPDERRERAAEHCRAMVRDHPKAWAFARSKARLRAVSANRRGAKTSTCGSEIAARCIENRDHRWWILADDLSEHSRNWICRTPHGLLRLLETAGLRRGDEGRVRRGLADYYTVGAAGSIRKVGFAWDSSIEVFSDPEKMTGTAPDGLWVDEAQANDGVVGAILDVVGPTMQEKHAEIWLSGTPGHEVDTFFGQVATAGSDTWEIHAWYSWDNPHYGITWRERYEAHVLSTVALLRDQYGVTDEQMEYLSGLTEATVYGVATHPVGSTLHESIRRHLFGIWVRQSAGMVYALGDVPAALWGPQVEPGKVSRVERGDGLLQDFLDAPRRWPEYVAELPKRASHGPHAVIPKRWHALLGADLGHYPDPFALVASVWSPQDDALWEIDSCKALNLGEDEQREALLAWIAGFVECGLVNGPEHCAVVVDSGGGGAASITASWCKRVAERFGIPVYAAEKHKTSVVRQVWLLNQDIRAGRHRVRRGSALHREMLHLQWRLTDAGKAEVDDKRKVALPDGTRAVTGDHCCDADRYLWYYSGHMDGRERDPSATPRRGRPPQTPEEMVAALERRMTQPRRRSRR